jgi:hypothetical protein
VRGGRVPPGEEDVEVDDGEVHRWFFCETHLGIFNMFISFFWSSKLFFSWFL